MSETEAEEVEVTRPPIPEMQVVYCIENFDGELIAHTRNGPLLFVDRDEAFKFMRVMEPSENSMRFSVTEVHMRYRKVKSFTEFGLNFMDDLKMPVGGIWLRDFQDGKEPKKAPGRPKGS